jgi:GNAT superfamily N-acetyltransferase
MPEVQPMVNLPGPSGQFVDVPQPPPNPGTIPAPAAPSILDIKRAEAMQRMNPQEVDWSPQAVRSRAEQFQSTPEALARRAAEVEWRRNALSTAKEAPGPAINPAVADESAVPMIQQMAQERTPNVLADVFRNISPEQRSEVIKAFDRNVITAAQEAVKKQLEAQGVTDPAIIESAMQAAKPDFADTVPARIAKARANKAEALFSAAREAGITPAKMEKLTPAKWEALSIKAGVRKPTWTANGSETVREVIQMAKEWEAKNGPIQAPPKPMKAPNVTPSALNTPEKIAAAEQLRQALAMEEAPVSTSLFGQLKDRLAKKFNVDVSIGPEGDAIELSKIVVPKDARGAGVGTAAMEDLIRYADENGKRIVITPSTDFGASSVPRLKQFYKRFGFVENSGKNKDFSTRQTMYRDPKGK